MARGKNARGERSRRCDPPATWPCLPQMRQLGLEPRPTGHQIWGLVKNASSPHLRAVRVWKAGSHGSESLFLWKELRRPKVQSSVVLRREQSSAGITPAPHPPPENLG